MIGQSLASQDIRCANVIPFGSIWILDILLLSVEGKSDEPVGSVIPSTHDCFPKHGWRLSGLSLRAAKTADRYASFAWTAAGASSATALPRLVMTIILLWLSHGGFHPSPAFAVP